MKVSAMEFILAPRFDIPTWRRIAGSEPYISNYPWPWLQIEENFEVFQHEG